RRISSSIARDGGTEKPSKIHGGGQLDPIRSIKGLEPILKRHPGGVQVVEHHIPDTNADVGAVLGDCRFGIKAHTDHVFRLQSPAKLKPLPVMARADERLSYFPSALFTL